MIEILEEFFGEYIPISAEVPVWNAATQEFDMILQPLSGFAGVNWPWVTSAALLLIVVWSIFRFVGGLFKR